jgi:hypothetical protein
MLTVIYVLFCLIVGSLGINRKFGFWGYFFASIVLSPLIGFILIFASDPKPVVKDNQIVMNDDE